jgi:hypothetical protein
MENRPNVSVPVSDLSKYPNASSTLKRMNDADKPKAKPKQEQIIKDGHVSLKKQSAWKRAKHRIFEQEGAELKEYVVNDVLIPSIKDTISNIVANGIDILLYGEARHTNKRQGIFGGTTRYGNYVSYNSISSNKSSSGGVRDRVASSASVRSRLALDDFIFQNRGEALDILDRMSTILTDYGIVTVADLYDMCGLKTPYTYNNYAWRDLSTAGVSLTRDGYLLSLPTPQVLD